MLSSSNAASSDTAASDLVLPVDLALVHAHGHVKDIQTGPDEQGRLQYLDYGDDHS